MITPEIPQSYHLEIIDELLKRVEKLKKENQKLFEENRYLKGLDENDEIYFFDEQTFIELDELEKALEDLIAENESLREQKSKPKLIRKRINVLQQPSTETMDFDKLVNLYDLKAVIFLVFLIVVCLLVMISLLL